MDVSPESWFPFDRSAAAGVLLLDQPHQKLGEMQSYAVVCPRKPGGCYTLVVMESKMYIGKIVRKIY